MSLLLGVLWPLERLNTFLLEIGRRIGVVALVVMVLLILGQVVARYVFNAAPSWTEEGARFGMLWMNGLMAPLAYRQGGFVAIDMVERALPGLVSGLLTLGLLLIATTVLVYALDIGINNHVNSLTGRGNAPSLRLPLDWLGGDRIRFKNSWAYASLAVGMGLLLLVNIELILRQLVRMLGGGDRLTDYSNANMARAD